VIEYAVLVLVALAVAAFVALPRRGDDAVDPGPALEALGTRRAVLLHQLRELDDDLAAGRISAADRLAGRRALGPELRDVTEALQAHDAAGAPS